MLSVSLLAAQFDWLTSVHRMTFPFALYSEPWNIFTLVIDSIDLPSIGLTTLQRGGKVVSSYLTEDTSWTENAAKEKYVTDQKAVPLVHQSPTGLLQVIVITAALCSLNYCCTATCRISLTGHRPKLASEEKSLNKGFSQGAKTSDLEYPC